MRIFPTNSSTEAAHQVIQWRIKLCKEEDDVDKRDRFYLMMMNKKSLKFLKAQIEYRIYWNVSNE